MHDARGIRPAESTVMSRLEPRTSFTVAVVSVLALLATADAVAQAIRGWAVHADTTIPEGSIIYSVRRLMQDGALYRDYNLPPYATTAYTPLLYTLTAGLAGITGGSHDVEVLYRCGRTVTILATLACLGSVWWLASRIVGARRAWLAPLSVALFGRLYPWICTTRPDALAAALSMAAVVTISRRDRPGRWTPVAAAVLAAGAMTAKQSSLSAPAAIMLYLFLNHGVLPAASFAGCFVLLTMGLFGLFQLVWPWFWANVFGANVAPMMPARSGILSAWYAFHAWPLLGLALVGWVSALRVKDRRVRLVQLHSLLSLAAAIAMCMKAGAALNYFLEATFALAVFVPLGLEIADRWRSAAVALKWIFVLAAWFFVTYRVAERWAFERPEPEAQTDAVLDRVRTYGVPVLFQDSGLAIRFGEPILLLDSFNASYLADARVLDITPLAWQLHEGSVKAVVLSQQYPWAAVWEVTWLPRAVAAEISAHYELADVAGKRAWIYAPAPKRDRPVPCHFRRDP